MGTLKVPSASLTDPKLVRCSIDECGHTEIVRPGIVPPGWLEEIVREPTSDHIVTIFYWCPEHWPEAARGLMSGAA